MLANTGTPIPGLLYSERAKAGTREKGARKTTAAAAPAQEWVWGGGGRGTNRNVLLAGNEFLRYLL